MKKNFTKYAGIALVALLTACNGSTITKEDAAKVAKNITAEQEKVEGLYKVVHMNATATTVDDGKQSKESFQSWYDADRHFFHSVSSVEEAGNTEKEEIYMGQIDGKYYKIDMVEKTYKEYSNLTAFEFAFSAEASETALSVVSLGSGASLEAMVASAVEEPKEDDPVTEFKSKGDGHLYVKSTQVMKDEEDGSEATVIGILVFDNNMIKSYEIKSTDSKSSDSVNMKYAFDYNVNAKMPSLNGLTEAK